MKSKYYLDVQNVKEGSAVTTHFSQCLLCYLHVNKEQNFWHPLLYPQKVYHVKRWFPFSDYMCFTLLQPISKHLMSIIEDDVQFYTILDEKK